MTYDTLMPEDIEPYLGGRSWEDLKVGDEIAFPELDDTLTPESLVGRRITLKSHTLNKEEEGTIGSFDQSTGKHEVAFSKDDKESFDLKDRTQGLNFAIEGAEAYTEGRGVCIIRELEGEVNVNARAN